MKRLLTLIAVLACFIPSVVWSSDGMSVPPYLVYQSQLYDDGGNLIADGDAEVEFRISDAQGTVLYEERQTVEVMRGGISALVGSGVDADGIPIGGLSVDVLNPEGPRYIEAQVVGMAATEPMEIASVPYAIYARQALGVAEGAIDSAALADGGVEFGDLSEELVERLGEELSIEGASGGLVSQGHLESQSGAASIGVSSSFSYSGANNLQGVLSDFDRAIRMRDEGANSAVEAEATARVAADSAEATARATGDSAEATTRATADSAEAAARASADGAEASARVANTNRIVALEGVPGVRAFTRAKASCDGDCNGYNIQQVIKERIDRHSTTSNGWATCDNGGGCEMITLVYENAVAYPYSATATVFTYQWSDYIAMVRAIRPEGVVIEVRDPASDEGSPPDRQYEAMVTVVGS